MFTLSRAKTQFAQQNSMNDFLKTHCTASAYIFEVRATCWQAFAKEEASEGRDPDQCNLTVHPTCPFGCRRPTQLLSQFAKVNYFPRPTKLSSNIDNDAPFLTYKDAKRLIDKGEKNAMDKYVPSMTVIVPKIKWKIAPVNTEGAEIQSASLCVVNNILCTVRCKNCGKPRVVYIVGGGAKLKSDDR